MDAAGVAFLGLAFWCGYCALKGFRPIAMAKAVVSNPSQASSIIQTASDARGVSTSSAPASGTGTSGVPNAALSSDPSTAALQGYAFNVLNQYGEDTAQQQSALVQLWNRESSWNPHAMNPSSGAYGIPQALPASKLPEGTATPPNGQIQWGVQYIVNRYGSPANAWQHEQIYGWY